MNTTDKTTTTKNKDDVKNMKDNFALIRVSFEPIFIFFAFKACFDLKRVFHILRFGIVSACSHVLS